jgi:hypothetical protein
MVHLKRFSRIFYNNCLLIVLNTFVWVLKSGNMNPSLNKIFYSLQNPRNFSIRFLLRFVWSGKEMFLRSESMLVWKSILCNLKSVGLNHYYQNVQSSHRPTIAYPYDLSLYKVLIFEFLFHINPLCVRISLSISGLDFNSIIFHADWSSELSKTKGSLNLIIESTLPITLFSHE